MTRSVESSRLHFLTASRNAALVQRRDSCFEMEPVPQFLTVIRWAANHFS